MRRRVKESAVAFIATIMVFAVVSCAQRDLPGTNLIDNEEEEKTTILLFVPMERSKPDAKNAARTAFDKTVIMAEERLNLTVEYRTYTSADYQEKTYDDVSIDRIRHDMDDFYLLNPDVLQKTGEEGRLADLSDLECAKNLREVVKLANTVDGKLMGILRKWWSTDSL